MKLLWRWFFLALLLVALPIFIWAVITQRIDLRKRAVTGEPPIVCWNRVGGSDGDFYWRDGCKGAPPNPELMCTQVIIPLTGQETYQYLQWVNAGKPYIPGCDISSNLIDWTTPYASLVAQDLTIVANGRTFKGIPDPGTTVNVHSDPGDDDYTTLEVEWREQGIPMRLFMYFYATDVVPSGFTTQGTYWGTSEIRTYNGNNPGDWITYPNRTVMGTVGSPALMEGLSFTSPTGNGQLSISGMRLQAFSPPPPLNQYGYSLEAKIGLPVGEIITLSTNPTTGYGVNVLLRNNQGVVTNQSGFRYSWYAANPSLLSIQTGTVPYDNGMCAYGIYAPCPYSNGQLRGLIYGNTTVNVDVIRNSDNVVIATTSFPVRVAPSPTPTPTASYCYYQEVQCIQAPCEPILICPSNYPTPTCMPRPICLDADPQCLIPEPIEGWCPTPTISCVRRSPAVTISPNDQSGRPGQTLPYTITFTNNDSLGCPNSDFSLRAQLAQGWTYTLTNTTVPNVFPGQNAGVNFNVTSASTSPNNTTSYPISAYVKNLSSNLEGRDDASYTLTTAQLGDANGDGRVDGVDYVIWLNHYNQQVSGASNGDFNGDGIVDGIDYVVWVLHYSR